jgi:hypothetical protein
MATTYLTRTQSAGNRRTYTFSAWMKRSKLGAYLNVFGTASEGEALRFENTNTLTYFFNGSSSGSVRTTQVFRDTNAWYHIVVSVDTSQATASNRLKIYVNGSQITDFDTETYPSQDQENKINQSGQTFYLANGHAETAGRIFDGVMAHVHFIDGTAYDASAFGETDATTGQWKPKSSPSVTYGTNGFFLKFANSGSMGTDSSGNGNNFTVAAGTLTQTQDTPSNVFATFNALDKATSVTLSNVNTKAVCSTANTRSVNSTLAVSKGKWYAEIEFDAGTAGIIGVVSTKFSAIRNYTTKAHQYSGSGGGVFYLPGNQIYIDGVDTSDAASGYTTGDIIGIALNLDDDEITFYKNGTSQAVVTSKTFDDDGYYFVVSHGSGSGSSTYLANFGNGYFGTTAVSSANSDDAGYGLFEYAPPTGYYSLCTKNINIYG